MMVYIDYKHLRQMEAALACALSLHEDSTALDLDEICQKEFGISKEQAEDVAMLMLSMAHPTLSFHTGQPEYTFGVMKDRTWITYARREVHSLKTVASEHDLRATR